MTTTKMTLEALSPEWLTAKADCDGARRLLKERQGILQCREPTNEIHHNELREKSRSKLTSAQALTRGSGSGFEVIHSACRCDSGVCEHDPTSPPFDGDQMEAARAKILEAKEALADSAANLDATEPTFDV